MSHTWKIAVAIYFLSSTIVQAQCTDVPAEVQRLAQQLQRHAEGIQLLEAKGGQHDELCKYGTDKGVPLFNKVKSAVNRLKSRCRDPLLDVVVRTVDSQFESYKAADFKNCEIARSEPPTPAAKAASVTVAKPRLKSPIEVVPQMGHSGKVNSIAYSPDRRHVVSGSSDDTLKLWDVATG